MRTVTKAIQKVQRANPYRESDKRIKEALQTLGAHERGKKVLGYFKAMAIDGGARGLDLAGMSALVTLTREMAYGRREFIESI